MTNAGFLLALRSHSPAGLFSGLAVSLCLLVTVIFSTLVLPSTASAQNVDTEVANNNTASGGNATIKTSVILPAATGAAQIIYNEVLEGVRSNPALDISTITLQSDTQIADVEQQVKSKQSKLVIAIGNKSYKLTKELNTDAMIIAGGISGKPNGIPMVSLTGDPEPTLAELKRIAPHLTSVRLVYNEDINGWWYKRAKTVAKKYDLEIVGYVADDIKDGVKLYEQLLDEAPAKKSAVWIPLRSVVPSKTILPLLLERAWSKKLAVISNNPSHTKLGSLIALYPAHRQMGSQLAEFAVQHYQQEASELIIGTRVLKVAINLRTSAHIGLRLSAKDRDSFHKIFPTKP